LSTSLKEIGPFFPSETPFAQSGNIKPNLELLPRNSI
jgi:hypothetical protein